MTEESRPPWFLKGIGVLWWGKIKLRAEYYVRGEVTEKR